MDHRTGTNNVGGPGARDLWERYRCAGRKDQVVRSALARCTKCGVQSAEFVLGETKRAERLGLPYKHSLPGSAANCSELYYYVRE